CTRAPSSRWSAARSRAMRRPTVTSSRRWRGSRAGPRSNRSCTKPDLAPFAAATGSSASLPSCVVRSFDEREEDRDRRHRRVGRGRSESLLTRAADVMLKERRTLIVVPREAPMSVIHLENLLAIARAGALVLPACPTFYGQPRTLEQLVDTVVGRLLDQLG